MMSTSHCVLAGYDQQRGQHHPKVAMVEMTELAMNSNQQEWDVLEQETQQSLEQTQLEQFGGQCLSSSDYAVTCGPIYSVCPDTTDTNMSNRTDLRPYPINSTGIDTTHKEGPNKRAALALSMDHSHGAARGMTASRRAALAMGMETTDVAPFTGTELACLFESLTSERGFSRVNGGGLDVGLSPANGRSEDGGELTGTSSPPLAARNAWQESYHATASSPGGSMTHLLALSSRLTAFLCRRPLHSLVAGRSRTPIHLLQVAQHPSDHQQQRSHSRNSIHPLPASSPLPDPDVQSQTTTFYGIDPSSSSIRRTSGVLRVAGSRDSEMGSFQRHRLIGQSRPVASRWVDRRCFKVAMILLLAVFCLLAVVCFAYLLFLLVSSVGKANGTVPEEPSQVTVEVTAVSVRIVNVFFLPEMRDNTSVTYTNFTHQFCMQVVAKMTGKQHFNTDISCYVVRLSPGSVVVDFELTISANKEKESIDKKIIAGLFNNTHDNCDQMHCYIIDPKSISVHPKSTLMESSAVQMEESTVVMQTILPAGLEKSSILPSIGVFMDTGNFVVTTKPSIVNGGASRPETVYVSSGFASTIGLGISQPSTFKINPGFEDTVTRQSYSTSKIRFGSEVTEITRKSQSTLQFRTGVTGTTRQSDSTVKGSSSSGATWISHPSTLKLNTRTGVTGTTRQLDSMPNVTGAMGTTRQSNPISKANSATGLISSTRQPITMSKVNVVSGTTGTVRQSASPSKISYGTGAIGTTRQSLLTSKVSSATETSGTTRQSLLTSKVSSATGITGTTRQSDSTSTVSSFTRFIRTSRQSESISKVSSITRTRGTTRQSDSTSKVSSFTKAIGSTRQAKSTSKVSSATGAIWTTRQPDSTSKPSSATRATEATRQSNSTPKLSSSTRATGINRQSESTSKTSSAAGATGTTSQYDSTLQVSSGTATVGTSKFSSGTGMTRTTKQHGSTPKLSSENGATGILSSKFSPGTMTIGITRHATSNVNLGTSATGTTKQFETSFGTAATRTATPKVSMRTGATGTTRKSTVKESTRATDIMTQSHSTQKFSSGIGATGILTPIVNTGTRASGTHQQTKDGTKPITILPSTSYSSSGSSEKPLSIKSTQRWQATTRKSTALTGEQSETVQTGVSPRTTNIPGIATRRTTVVVSHRTSSKGTVMETPLATVPEPFTSKVTIIGATSPFVTALSSGTSHTEKSQWTTNRPSPKTEYTRRYTGRTTATLNTQKSVTSPKNTQYRASSLYTPKTTILPPINPFTNSRRYGNVGSSIAYLGSSSSTITGSSSRVNYINMSYPKTTESFVQTEKQSRKDKMLTFRATTRISRKTQRPSSTTSYRFGDQRTSRYRRVATQVTGRPPEGSNTAKYATWGIRTTHRPTRERPSTLSRFVSRITGPAFLHTGAILTSTLPPTFLLIPPLRPLIP